MLAFGVPALLMILSIGMLLALTLSFQNQVKKCELFQLVEVQIFKPQLHLSYRP